MKRFLVLPAMLVPMVAHAAEGLHILDRLAWHGAGIWQSMVEYALHVGRAALGL